MRFACAAALFLVSAWSPIARAQADFERDSAAWNGASRFVDIVRERSDALIPDELDLDDLRADDAVMIVAPDRALPEDELVEFVRRGGRLVIADDLGTGVQLFTRFGMRIRGKGATTAPRVRGEDALVVARPFFAHPLTEGVGVVVTNEPMLLEHPRLVPLIALEEGRAGVVVTGVVGEGRVVAVSDPSIFINAMMALRGNAKLASNIVAFATEGTPPRRLFVMLPGARFVGDFDGNEGGSPRERVERRLRTLATMTMPDLGLQAAGALLALLCVTLLMSMGNGTPEPALPWLDRGEAAPDLRSARDERLRESIERTLARRFGLPESPNSRDLMRALNALRMSPDDEHLVLRALEADSKTATLRLAAARLDEAFRRRDAARELAPTELPPRNRK